MNKELTLTQITTCFIELCAYNELSPALFNLHLYDEYIEASICEECDLGEYVRSNYIEATCYSEGLSSRESITNWFKYVLNLNKEFNEEVFGL